MSESESSQEVTETSMHRAETNDRSRLATLIISFTLFVLKFLIVDCYRMLLIDKCSIVFNTVGVEKFEEIVIFLDVKFFVCRI